MELTGGSMEAINRCKPLWKRLRELVDSGKPIHETMPECSPCGMYPWDYKAHVCSLLMEIADEIEREYIPRKEAEAEKQRIITAQKDSAHHIMRLYAGRIGKPMLDGENITGWLDRWFIPRPRFEDGKPIKIGDEVENGVVKFIDVSSDGSWSVSDEKAEDLYIGNSGEPMKRPVLKVLDVDGVEIKVGDIVWLTTDGSEHHVSEVESGGIFSVKECELFYPKDIITHEQPVFDADGVRIRKDDTVWRTTNGAKCVVENVDAVNYRIEVRYDTGVSDYVHPDYFTHNEPDSLEKLRDDILERVDELEGTPYKGTRNKLLVIADRLTALKERGE